MLVVNCGGGRSYRIFSDLKSRITKLCQMLYYNVGITVFDNIAFHGFILSYRKVKKRTQLLSIKHFGFGNFYSVIIYMESHVLYNVHNMIHY